MQVLEDFQEQPVLFRNFGSNEEGTVPADVTTILRVVQRFLNGIGTLGYDDMKPILPLLSEMDKMRLYSRLGLRRGNEMTRSVLDRLAFPEANL